MKINEIPTQLNIPTDKEFALSVGITPQNWNQYKNGDRGKISTVEKKIMLTHDLSKEEIFFRPAFHVHHEDTPQYWLSLAHEALRQANRRGVDTLQIEKLIFDIGSKLEDDFDHQIFIK